MLERKLLGKIEPYLKQSGEVFRKNLRPVDWGRLAF